MLEVKTFSLWFELATSTYSLDEFVKIIFCT
jgi:hypothetical protein